MLFWFCCVYILPSWYPKGLISLLFICILDLYVIDFYNWFLKDEYISGYKFFIELDFINDYYFVFDVGDFIEDCC